MDILVKNVTPQGQTEAEVAALLVRGSALFKGCEVVFQDAEAKAVGFEQAVVKELHTAFASIKHLLGLDPAVPPAAVVAAVEVAATLPAVTAIAESPVVAAAVAAAPDAPVKPPVPGTS